jgi:hypothetical protein
MRKLPLESVSGGAMGRPRKNPTRKKKCKQCNQVRSHCTVKDKERLRPVSRCVDCEARRKKTARNANLEEERAKARLRAAKWRQTEAGQAHSEKKRTDPRIKDYQRRYQREWAQSDRGKEVTRASYERAKGEGKVAARQAVRLALRRGELIRPETCQQCGSTPGVTAAGRSLIEGDHFKGYAPEHHLTIRWLCKPCHGAKKRGPRRETGE